MAVRDGMFFRKVCRFIESVGFESDTDLADLQSRLGGDKADRERTVGVLVTALERSFTLDKVDVLAAIFLALTRGAMTPKDFRACSFAIDQIYIDDLRLFLEPEKVGLDQADYLYKVAHTSLVVPQLSSIALHSGTTYYVESELGLTLRAANRQGRGMMDIQSDPRGTGSLGERSDE